MTDGIELELHGNLLHLLGERAVLRARDRTLFIADVHIGKAASFRANGIAVPRGTTGTTLDRLSALLERCSADRLVILGDFLHSRAGRQPHTEQRVMEWRAAHRALRVELVRGNHDRMAGDPDPALNIIVRDAPVVDAGLQLLHHPGNSGAGPWLAGHLHPGVELFGPARQRHFLPCFHLCGDGLILPAFGEFTGLAKIAPCAGDRVFVIADGRVIEVGALTRDAR